MSRVDGYIEVRAGKKETRCDRAIEMNLAIWAYPMQEAADARVRAGTHMELFISRRQVGVKSLERRMQTEGDTSTNW